MKPLVKVLFGLFAVAATATPASAQFGFGNRSVYTRNVGVFYATPFGGYYLTQQRFSTTVYNYPAGLYRGIYPAPLTAPAIGSFGLTPAFYGGVVVPTAGGVDQDAINLRKAQRAARNDPVARRKVVDEAVIGGGKAADPARPPVAEPNEADVLTGRALNELLREIAPLQAKANVKAPFLTPELLSHVVFTGGPAADAMNLFRGDTPTFPDALRRSQFDQPRDAVAKEYLTVAESLKAGKPADPVVLDRLAAAIAFLKEQFAPVLRASAGVDPDHAADFLNRIEAAAAHLKTPAAADLLVPGWHTVGASTAELTRHLSKHKIEFAPAPADDDGAYWAIYRGLAAYKADLVAAR